MNENPDDRSPREPADGLTELLRAGDPYRGEELDPDARRTIRAAMARAAADRPAAAPRWLPAAATLLLAAALWVAWPETPDHEAGSPRPLPEAPEVSTPELSHSSSPRTVAAPPAAENSTPSAETPQSPAGGTGGVVAAPAPALVAPAVHRAPSLAAPAAGTTARSLHFTAPGGTRIVWTLDPTFALADGPR